MENEKNSMNQEEEKRLFYQAFIDGIKFSKQQQWYNLYITIAAIGAIIVIFNMMSNKEIKTIVLDLRIPFIIVVVILGLFGIISIVVHHCSMCSYRKHKENIMSEFKYELKKGKEICDFFKGPYFLIVFIVSILMAVIISIVFIWYY